MAEDLIIRGNRAEYYWRGVHWVFYHGEGYRNLGWAKPMLRWNPTVKRKLLSWLGNDSLENRTAYDPYGIRL